MLPCNSPKSDAKEKYYQIPQWGINTNFERNYSRKYVGRDMLLNERILKYLETNKNRYISCDTLITHLKEIYPLYKRMTYHAMKWAAIGVISELSGVPRDKDSNITTNDVCTTSATEQNQDKPNLNDHLQCLYAKRDSKQCADAGDCFTIDSGSDENDVEIVNDAEECKRRKIEQNGTVEDVICVDVTKETPKGNVPGVTFADVVGCDKVLTEVTRLIAHVLHPEIYEEIGIDPPRGFLLHGPPGCGKTLLAHAVAGELKIPLMDVAAPELIAGVSGVSEQKIRKLFDNAVKTSPCVLFIDEIDCITQNRDTANRDMERRVVSQLLSSMDKLSRDPRGSRVLIIGATNRPDSLDPALRRAGRFDREVCLGIPDRDSRRAILAHLCSKLKLDYNVDFDEMAKLTPGYVAADLLSLIRESALSAVQRGMDELEKCSRDKKNEGEASRSDWESVPGKSLLSSLRFRGSLKKEDMASFSIVKGDFESSLKRVQPSSKREGFATVPDVSWDDVGSLSDIRRELEMAILAPVKYQKEFSQLGLPISMGVLLCGPPGCGKTLLAKAVANEAGINFISVKGPELLNMYVGGSEKAVRECFQRAKNSQPCVIFFDELDALCPKRADYGESGTSMRVVNQLLTEMDGIEARPGVYVMAATNRPDIIDPAVLRPGRFDKILYVGFPNAVDRADILKALTKNGTKPKLAPDVNLHAIAAHVSCEGYTGADLAALVRDASVASVRDVVLSGGCRAFGSILVSREHFQKAMRNLRPSVCKTDRVHYEKLRLKYATSPYLANLHRG